MYQLQVAAAFIDGFIKQCADTRSSQCTLAFIDTASFATFEALLRAFADTWTARLKANDALASKCRHGSGLAVGITFM